MSFSALFVAASLAAGLPPGLLSAVCYVESRHNLFAVHHHDGDGTSYGICQIKMDTARQVGFKGNAVDLMKPENNIKYAGLYLKQQLTRYKGDYARAITAYNRGHSESHGGSAYCAKVLNRFFTGGY